MCRLPTSFLLDIQSRVKQEVDMSQIQNCVTGYSLCAKYQEGGLRGSEKNVTEFFCDADADDVRRRIVIPICRLR